MLKNKQLAVYIRYINLGAVLPAEFLGSFYGSGAVGGDTDDNTLPIASASDKIAQGAAGLYLNAFGGYSLAADRGAHSDAWRLVCQACASGV